MLCHQHILWIIYVIRKDRFFILSSLFYTGWALLGRGLTTHTFQSLNCVQFMWWCNKHNMYYSKFYTRLIYYVTAFLDFFTFHSVFTPPEMKKCIKYSLFLFFYLRFLFHTVFIFYFLQKRWWLKLKMWAVQFRKTDDSTKHKNFYAITSF